MYDRLFVYIVRDYKETVIIIILHNCRSTKRILNREDSELSQNSDLQLFHHGFENYYMSPYLIPYIIIISFLYET